MSFLILGLFLLGVFFLFAFSKNSVKEKNDISVIEDSHELFMEWETQFIEGNSSEVRERFFSKVVGVTFNNYDGVNRQEVISKCSTGERLILVPDYYNKHDENAVKVCRINKEQLGYVNSDLAEDIRQLMIEEKSRVDVWISKITGDNVLGVNIEIRKYYLKAKIKREKQKNIEIAYDSSIKMHRNSYERSVQAKQLEKEGYIDNAIEMYETIVDRGFSAPVSYKRLTVIYRRRKEYSREIEVIKKLIKMYKKEYGDHYDIEYMEERLRKAEVLNNNK